VLREHIAQAPSDDAYQWLLLFLVAWCCRNRISETAMKQILAALAIFFRLLGVTVVPWDNRPPPLLKDAFVIPPSTPWPSAITGGMAHAAVTHYDKYVICPEKDCGAVYTLQDALTPVRQGRCTRPVAVSVESPGIHFAFAARPPDASMCGEPLFKLDPKKLNSRNDRSTTPLLMFPFAGLKRGLQNLVLRPGFEDLCEEWRGKYYNKDHKRKEWSDVTYDAETGWPNPVVRGEGAEQEDVSPAMSDVHQSEEWERYQHLGADNKPFMDAETADRMAKRVQYARRRASGYDAPDASRRPKKAKVTPTAASSAPAASAATAAGPAAARADVRQPLLAQPGVLALQLNVDWFQPHKNRSYSMGGVYMTVLNLPREVRYRMENVILIGVLPGPKSTSRVQLQGALKPLVAELNELFQGVRMPSHNAPHGKLVRAFLFNIVCDTDARAPISGAMGHAAKKGCAYCEQSFPCRDFSWSATMRAVGESMLAEPRTNESHRAAALQWAAMPLGPAPERDKQSARTGSRWCALMDLPYFDTVRGVPLDAMHNIFLGTCKALSFMLINPHSVPLDSDEARLYMSTLAEDGAALRAAALSKLAKAEQAKATKCAEAAAKAKPKAPVKRKPPRPRRPARHEEASSSGSEDDSSEEGEEEEEEEEKKIETPMRAMIELPPLLAESDLDRLQEYMNLCDVPRDVAHIPNKIGRKMSKFKAAEWANWITIFAVPHLMELMREKYSLGKPFRFGERHLRLFDTMRDVAETMRGYSFTAAKVLEVEKQMHSIIVGVEQLFGPKAVKPNMHFSLHLGEMIMRFGPPASFSCNAYERYNGLLSNVPMNRAFPETSTIRRALHLIGVCQRVSRAEGASSTAALPLAGQPIKHAVRSDYEFILEMLSGTGEKELTTNDSVTVTLRETASGARQVRSKWATAESLRVYLRALDVTGSESFPGVLRNPATPVDLKDARAADWTRFIAPDRVMNGLMHHYLEAYKVEYPGHTNDELRARFHNLYTLINIHTTLDLGGQVFGSRLGGNFKSSRIVVEYLTGGRWVPWYANVDFYFTHDFQVPTRVAGNLVSVELPRGKLGQRLVGGEWTTKLTKHYFAAVQWYHTGEGNQGQNLFEGIISNSKEQIELKHKLLVRNNPYLNIAEGDANKNAVDRIVCVQQLAGRWIACRRTAATIQAMRIPFGSRQHV
jgi:hypothetical protein